MPNLTLSIPEETKRKLDEHKSIKWSRVVRSIIEQKLESFEKADKIAQKSKLSLEDFESLSKKLISKSRKHAEELLYEGNS